MPGPHLIIARLYEHLEPWIEVSDTKTRFTLFSSGQTSVVSRAADPIGQNARVVVRHGKAAAPRTLRMPRR